MPVENGDMAHKCYGGGTCFEALTLPVLSLSKGACLALTLSLSKRGSAPFDRLRVSATLVPTVAVPFRPAYLHSSVRIRFSHS